MLMYGKNHHNTVIILQLKQINKLKKNSFVLCPAPCQRRGVRVGWEAELFPTHTPEIVVLWPMSSGLITARQGSALFSDDQL